MKLGLGYIFMGAIIWNFDRATHVPLIQNGSYQLIPKKTKNNDAHERQY